MSFLPMHLLWQISESRSTGRLLCPDFFLYRDFTRFQGPLHPSDGMFYLIFWSFVAFTLAKLHLPWQVTHRRIILHSAFNQAVYALSIFVKDKIFKSILDSLCVFECNLCHFSDLLILRNE
jgi:hypothetical protein